MAIKTKRTPDRKVAQGGIAAIIAGAVTAWLSSRFHFTPLETQIIPPLVTAAAGFVAAYMAPYQPRIEEIIAWVKKLLNEVPSAA